MLVPIWATMKDLTIRVNCIEKRVGVDDLHKDSVNTYPATVQFASCS